MLGRQTPTFEWRPRCVGNAAVEAIELYESLGPRLDPWQRGRLEMGLGEDRHGDWATPEVGLEVPRQNGKGGVTEPVELAGLFVWGERTIIHTAHLIDTSKNAFKRTVELVENSDDLIRRVKRVNRTNGEEAIELLDGAILKFRTRTGRGGRGLSGERLMFDEAQELEPDQMDALVPTILARPNPQIWYTFTPPKRAGQFVVRLRARARAHEPGLAYAEWASPRGADLSDPRVMAEVNPAYGIRVTPKTLAIAYGVLGEEGYARECGGIWPPDEDAQWAVISEDDWTGREVPDSRVVGRPALAVDVPPDRSWAAIGLAGPNQYGQRHVEITGGLAGLDLRPGTGWVIPRLKELRRWRPLVIIINDKTLADDAEREGLVVHRATVADMVSSFGMLYDGVAGDDVEARDVVHIGQQELSDAVAGATTRDVAGALAWDRRNPLVILCPVPAVSLALLGLSTPRLHREVLPSAAVVNLHRKPEVAVPAPAEVQDVNAARVRERMAADLARMGAN